MKIALGISGGVDSSVAALLLKQQGYEVIALFMKNWEDTKGQCSAALDYEDALRVADSIGIPCYSFNFSEEYRESVFAHFLSELKSGRTPNPDVLCNREIKFKVLLQKSREIGAKKLATGHYCRTKKGKLFRGVDPNKDQSYFLHLVQGEVLQDILFPVGELQKSDVRQLARLHALSTSEKKDSTGICFIGKRNFKEFVADYIAYHPGDLCTLDGKKVGMHDGAAYYTIGQRKGLGIGGEGDAWFVAGKDHGQNIVYVVQGKDHPALFSSCVFAKEPHWIGDIPSYPFSCTAKVRYRQEDQSCTVRQTENGLITHFDQHQRAAAPGQSIVFYHGEECLGGAIITGSE